jgi:hypothetical protein
MQQNIFLSKFDEYPIYSREYLREQMNPKLFMDELEEWLPTFSISNTSFMLVRISGASFTKPT